MAEEVLDQAVMDGPGPGPGLADKHRAKLDSIVQQMMKNKESDNDIQMVVNDFKQKYSTQQPAIQQPKQEQPAFKPATDWLNIKQPEYTPIEAGNVVNEHTIKTGQAAERVKNHLLDMDESVHNLIRDRKKDILGRETSEALGINPSESGPINFQAQQLAQKSKQDVYISPAEVEGYKEAMAKDHLLMRQGLAQKAKDLENSDPIQAKSLKGDIYQLDRQNDPKKDKQIAANIEKIKKGELDYDVANGVLTKPVGFFGGIVEGFKQKGQAFDEYGLFSSGDEAGIIKHLNEKIKGNPDEPTVVGKEGFANVLPGGEAGMMVGGQPLKPLAGGALAGWLGGPQAGTAAMGLISAPEMYKLGYANALPQNYAEIKKKNPDLSDTDAYHKASELADKQATVDAATGMAMGLVGGELAFKPTGLSTGLLQKSVSSALKQIGETGAKKTLEGLGIGAMGATGQVIKNLMSQHAGLPVDEAAGVLDQFKVGVGMTLGLTLAAKIPTLLKPKTYNELSQAISKQPPQAIDATLESLQKTGHITPEEAQTVQAAIKEHAALDNSIKPEVPESDRLKVIQKIKERNGLDASLEIEDKAYHAETKEKSKALNEEINNISKGGDRGELQTIVDNAKIEGPAKTYLRDLSEKELKEAFKEIASQAHDPFSEKQAIVTYGEDIVNKAKELFPKEEPKESKISIIQPGEIQRPEVRTIAPREQPKDIKSTKNVSVIMPSDAGAGKVPAEQIGHVEVSEHGEDAKTAAGKENGIGPSPLTEDGMKEAKQLGQYIADNNKAKIITSEVERGLQTAEEAAKEAKRITGKEIPIERNELLNTANIGSDEGKPEGTFKEKEWFEGKYLPDGAESPDAFKARMEKAYEYVKSLPEDTHVVSHSKVMRALDALSKTDGKWTDETTNIFLKNKELTHAVPVEKSNEMDVRQQATNGEAMGTGNAQPENPTGEEVGGQATEEGKTTGKEGIGGPPPSKPIDMADYGEGGKELDKLANNIPDSGKVAEYMSKGTIEKYTGETPTNDQARGVQELGIALNHGEQIIEKAKQLFGNDYAEKTLDYIDNSTAGVSNKALMYVSLENALGREKLANPERAAEITKQQALVYAKSQAFARENSLALNYQKLRRIAKVGYDIDKITENFFSPEEREGRKNISKAVEADPDAINKQAAENEAGTIAHEVEKAIKEGVAKEIEKIYNKLPKDKKTLADKAISALDKIHNKLRNKTYESMLGIPIAIIDGGVLTIRNAIKAGVKIADAVEIGIAKIKEKYKDWAKEDEFRKDLLNGFREQGVDDEVNGTSKVDKIKYAENNIQKKINTIRDEIIAGEREVKNKKDKLQSKKLDQLRDQKKTLETFRDKYLPKGEDPYVNEKTAKTVEKRLINENIELNRQIEKGEKDKAENKITVESEAIEKLKAERDARKEILELIDPTPKDYVKNALIQQGFGREKVIKGEKKQILDWKKLAGAAGTVSKISENIGKVLENDGFSESQLERIKDAFIQEYVDLRTSVIEKAQNELARRNKESVTQEQKSAAKKLAELYTYGLFDQQPETFENALNKALGAKVSERGFNEAREIAKGMETLYSSSFQGVKLNDISAKVAIEHLDNKMRLLLAKESKGQGNFNFRAANIVRNYFDLQQTMVLNNLKQAVENPLSGFQQEVIEKIGGMIGKEGIGTPEMGAQRRSLMKSIYKDMVLNGSIGYGKTESAFVNRTHLDDHIDKLSDNKIYHGVMSVLSGKATLNAADAMYKASITEKKFAHNLIKILSHETNPNRLSPADAINFVSEKLTGQTLENAKASAKEIIEKINKDAGKELIPTTPESINRFANDIVKAALEMGGQITTEQIAAAYNAAYKAAGLGLGHEANNILSSTVSGYSAKLEKRINEAVKDKEWNRAAILTAQSILFRNVLNPFVGGGTNWLVLKFEKTGLGLLTGLGYQIGSNAKIDLGTEVGMKTLEKNLYNQARIKDNYMRGLVGGAASTLTYLAFTGLANTDEYRKWRGKNQWASRYLDIITPEMLLTKMAVENKAVKKYIAGTINKNDAFDATTKLMTAADNAVKGHSDKAVGALGEAIGSKFNLPLPWRLVKDGQVIYQGVTGQDPYHGNYKPSTGFLNGVFQGGAIEWMGLRPGGAPGSTTSTHATAKKGAKIKHTIPHKIHR